MKRLNKNGVSLAELLAVVVIMGIIAAIAIPLVGNVIETSKKKAFLGDVTTVVEAARTYCMVKGDNVGICKEYSRVDNDVASSIARGSFAIHSTTGAYIQGTNSNPVSATPAPATDASFAFTTILDDYMSKKMANIGTAKIIYDGTLYWININGDSTQGFHTKGFINPIDTSKTVDDFIQSK